MSAIEDRPNLDFLLYDVLRVGSLFSSKLFEHCHPGTVAVIFDSAQTRAEEEFHPCAAAIGANEPRLNMARSACRRKLERRSWPMPRSAFSAVLLESWGGMQLPYVEASALNRMFMVAMSNWLTMR